MIEIAACVVAAAATVALVLWRLDVHRERTASWRAWCQRRGFRP